MLAAADPAFDAVRLATADALEKYAAGSPLIRTTVSRASALEESFFLGLRLNRGVDLRDIAGVFGQPALESLRPAMAELVRDGLLQQSGDCIRLTHRGRLFSNEVFQAFLAPAGVASQA